MDARIQFTTTRNQFIIKRSSILTIKSARITTDKSFFIYCYRYYKEKNNNYSCLILRLIGYVYGTGYQFNVLYLYFGGILHVLLLRYGVCDDDRLKASVVDPRNSWAREDAVGKDSVHSGCACFHQSERKYKKKNTYNDSILTRNAHEFS